MAATGTIPPANSTDIYLRIKVVNAHGYPIAIDSIELIERDGGAFSEPAWFTGNWTIAHHGPTTVSPTSDGSHIAVIDFLWDRSDVESDGAHSYTVEVSHTTQGVSTADQFTFYVSLIDNVPNIDGVLADSNLIESWHAGALAWAEEGDAVAQAYTVAEEPMIIHPIDPSGDPIGRFQVSDTPAVMKRLADSDNVRADGVARMRAPFGSSSTNAWAEFTNLPDNTKYTAIVLVRQRYASDPQYGGSGFVRNDPDGGGFSFGFSSGAALGGSSGTRGVVHFGQFSDSVSNRTRILHYGVAAPGNEQGWVEMRGGGVYLWTLVIDCDLNTSRVRLNGGDVYYSDTMTVSPGAVDDRFVIGSNTIPNADTEVFFVAAFEGALADPDLSEHEQRILYHFGLWDRHASRFDYRTDLSASPVALYRAEDLGSGAITSWPDTSGNGRHLAGTATVLASATPVGGKAVAFDGVADVLKSSAFTAIDNGTAIIVGRMVSGDVPIWAGNLDTSDHVLLYLRSNGTISLYSGAGNESETALNDHPNVTGYCVYIVDWADIDIGAGATDRPPLEGSNISYLDLYVNLRRYSDAHNHLGDTILAVDAVHLGASPAPVYGDCEIAEVAIFDQHLTIHEKMLTTAQLMAKYGIDAAQYTG